jgi:Undecaprenyl-phosphate glucose phosphotransferase
MLKLPESDHAGVPVIDAPIAARSRAFALSPMILPGIVQALDVACIMIAAMAVSAFSPAASLDSYALVCAIFVCFSHLVTGDRAELFAINAIMRPIKRADDVIISLVSCSLLLLSLIFAFDLYERFSRHWMVLFVLGSCTLTVTARLALAEIARRLSERLIIGKNLAVLGVGEQSSSFLQRFSATKPHFFHLVGIYRVDDEPAVINVGDYPVLGDVTALFDAVRAGAIDDVVIATPWSDDRVTTATIERLKELPVHVYLSMDLVGFDLNFRSVMGSFRELPMFEVLQRPIAGWGLALKAIEDYAITLVLIIALAPLMGLVAVLIKLDSPGPVLFRQERLGFNNRRFHIYKFRSMYHNGAPEKVVRQARKGDPRVTRVGRIIRATSIDELPQLFNVLDGTMSLVGPRPHAVSHNEEYGRQIRGYFARHKVKPGITGWAQVKGLRGETDKLEKMERRIRQDIYYAENWSVFFDMRILFLTLFVVLFQKSAY